MAECGFGLIGGLTLGAAWAAGEQEEPLDPPSSPLTVLTPIVMIVLALDLLLAFTIADDLDNFGGWIGKAPFAFLVPALALLTARSSALSLLLGAAMPIVVTLWNVQEYWAAEMHLMSAGPSVAGLIALSAVAALSVRRWCGHPRALFLFVAWSGVACAWLKMCIPPPADWRTPILVQGIFTLMAGWLTFGMNAASVRKTKLRN